MVDDDEDITNKTHEFEKVNVSSKITVLLPYFHHKLPHINTNCLTRIITAKMKKVVRQLFNIYSML